MWWKYVPGMSTIAPPPNHFDNTNLNRYCNSDRWFCHMRSQYERSHSPRLPGSLVLPLF